MIEFLFGETPSNLERMSLSMRRFSALIIVAGALTIPLWFIGRGDSARPVFAEIKGEVRDEIGPVAQALVRIKGRPEFVHSDEQGRFQLPRVGGMRVTASKGGYFIAGASINTNPLVLELHRLPDRDCERYAWVDPTPNSSQKMNCGNCHAGIHDEWNASRHAHSATNRRFLNLYEGNDWYGKPNAGWNLLKDYPEGAGVCSSCHAPTQKSAPFAEFDIRDAAKEFPALSGVHCDYCHKISGRGDGQIGLTHGRYQVELLRPDPSADHQLFFGPLDDVDRGDDVYSRFQRDSRLCAACHEGVVFGVPVYSTYSEWRASPSARAKTSCQQCHMAPTRKMTNIAPGKGGIRRDPGTLGNHHFFDGSQLDMLRKCLKLEASARPAVTGVELDISLTAQSVGHSVPTGFIDRQVILLVEAFAGNKGVGLVQGPTLPEVMGPGEAGRPGLLYAKVLLDEKGKGPVPFWRADPASLKDTRLKPGQTDRHTFVFPAGTDRIRLRLVHRRFWKQVAEEKKWQSDEQVILEREIEVK